MSKKAKEHIAQVMERFHKGRLLRASDGTRLHPGNPKDESRAKAIAMSEGRAGDERGFVKRTWRGSTRERPKKAK
jgi:hypothetical protein